jgi:hypothetical protein
MTLFTVDVSENQAGLTVHEVKRAGYAGLMARCSIGSRADSEYSRFRAEARAEALPFAPYHFLKSHSHTPLDRQAQALSDAIGDRSLRVMLDVESDHDSLPSWDDVEGFYVHLVGEGLKLGSLYLPHWYWLEIGQPAIHWPLVASTYGPTPQPVNRPYPGDDEWPAAYGGVGPFLWQFKSRGRLPAGYKYQGDLDVNAYRGTPLPGSVFKHWVPPITAQEEEDMKNYLVRDASPEADGGWVIAADLSTKVKVSEDAYQALRSAGLYLPNPGLDQTTLGHIPDAS